MASKGYIIYVYYIYYLGCEMNKLKQPIFFQLSVPYSLILMIDKGRATRLGFFSHTRAREREEEEEERCDGR